MGSIRSKQFGSVGCKCFAKENCSTFTSIPRLARRLAVLEHLKGFRLQNHRVFLMCLRYSPYLPPLLSGLCVFLLLSAQRIRLALLGAPLPVLYSRFWAEQFTSIKYMPFMATVCAGMVFVSLCDPVCGQERRQHAVSFPWSMAALNGGESPRA